MKNFLKKTLVFVMYLMVMICATGCAQAKQLKSMLIDKNESEDAVKIEVTEEKLDIDSVEYYKEHIKLHNKHMVLIDGIYPDFSINDKEFTFGKTDITKLVEMYGADNLKFDFVDRAECKASVGGSGELAFLLAGNTVKEMRLIGIETKFNKSNIESNIEMIPSALNTENELVENIANYLGEEFKTEMSEPETDENGNIVLDENGNKIQNELSRTLSTGWVIKNDELGPCELNIKCFNDLGSEFTELSMTIKNSSLAKNKVKDAVVFDPDGTLDELGIAIYDGKNKVTVVNYSDEETYLKETAEAADKQVGQ